jgi:hypothetical protein
VALGEWIAMKWIAFVVLVCLIAATGFGALGAA